MDRSCDLRRWATPLLVLATLLVGAPAVRAADIGDMARGGARLDDAVLGELNLARTHPGAYAERLRRYRQAFDGLIARADEGGVDEETEEGVAAVDEAIAFLERQRPLAPLSIDPGLGEAASDQARGQGESGGFGHASADGSSFDARIGRRVGWRGAVAEDISYGEANAVAVVRQLIVDDGVADRGHRTNIFDPALAFAGVGCGPHRVYDSLCVIDFAAGVVPH